MRDCDASFYYLCSHIFIFIDLTVPIYLTSLLDHYFFFDSQINRGYDRLPAGCCKNTLSCFALHKHEKVPHFAVIYMPTRVQYVGVGHFNNKKITTNGMFCRGHKEEIIRFGCFSCLFFFHAD